MGHLRLLRTIISNTAIEMTRYTTSVKIGRLGFHDGIDGAQKDIQNHRRPDVRNRDEFCHPHVPGYARNEYRDAFRRGYSVSMQHILGGPYRQF